MVGIPLSNDQKTNLNDAKLRGIAHVIPWKIFAKDDFLTAIKDVLDDSGNRYLLILL